MSVNISRAFENTSSSKLSNCSQFISSSPIASLHINAAINTIINKFIVHLLRSCGLCDKIAQGEGLMYPNKMIHWLQFKENSINDIIVTKVSL